jgi:hypothetical protein
MNWLTVTRDGDVIINLPSFYYRSRNYGYCMFEHKLEGETFIEFDNKHSIEILSNTKEVYLEICLNDRPRLQLSLPY